MKKSVKNTFSTPDSCEGIPVIAEVPWPAGDDEAFLGALLPMVEGRDQARDLEDGMA